jgi:hypothetical protein
LDVIIVLDFNGRHVHDTESHFLEIR